MKHSVKTNIYTLKRVWNILKDLHLEQLLTGGSVEVNITNLLNTLLTEDKLTTLCQVITGNDTEDFEQCELSEIMELLKAFFTATAEQFKTITSSVNTVKSLQETGERKQEAELPSATPTHL